MARLFTNTVSLRTKFVIFIGAIISAFYFYMLHRTAVFDQSMILKQAEQQARMLYQQILLTRQWASDHNGLFILKRKGVEANPHLDLPTVTDMAGQTYFLRNPAMITRELSAYAKRDGLGFFRVTSLRPVNPNNEPDEFERHALRQFNEGKEEVISTNTSEEGRVVRFIQTKPTLLSKRRELLPPRLLRSNKLSRPRKPLMSLPLSPLMPPSPP